MERNVVLVGPMGSGKTTVGRLLAGRLGWRLVDTDERITVLAGRPIPEIFATAGEAAFRDLERQAVAQAAALARTVIATGGGAPVAAANRQALRQQGWVVWLRATAATLHARLAQGDGVAARPLLREGNPLARLAELNRSRARAYREAAHWALETDGLEAAAVADRILAEYQAWGQELQVVAGPAGARAPACSYIGRGLLGRLGDLVAQTAPDTVQAMVVSNGAASRLYLAPALASLAAAGIAAAAAPLAAADQPKQGAALVVLGGSNLLQQVGRLLPTDSTQPATPCILVPTTLASQLTVGVGLGPPALAMVADVDTLVTAPPAGFAAALAAAATQGLSQDADLFAQLERDAVGLQVRQPAALAALVAAVCHLEVPASAAIGQALQRLWADPPPPPAKG